MTQTSAMSKAATNGVQSQHVAPTFAPEGVEAFLSEAQHEGCVRVELRAEGREEATSIVRSWALSKDPSSAALVAQKIQALGEEESRNLARGVTRFYVLAWSETGPWGRKTISFGELQQYAPGHFSESDANAAGMIAEAIRDRQFGQRMNYNALQLVVNHLSAMVDRFAVMHDRTEAKYIELVDAFEKVMSANEDRAIKREELRIKQATQERMIETVTPLIPPVANRLLAFITGAKGVLAPEMFDSLIDIVAENDEVGMKLVMAFPEEKRPVVFELLKVFEARKIERDKEKAAHEKRKERITAEQTQKMGELADVPAIPRPPSPPSPPGQPSQTAEVKS